MDLGEEKWAGVDWMHVAEDRDRWQALVNTEMFHTRRGICWLAE